MECIAPGPHTVLGVTPLTSDFVEIHPGVSEMKHSDGHKILPS